MGIAIIRKAAILCILFMLVGCATEEKYKAVLNTWINWTPLDLIRSWGPPKQTYEVDDHQFLVYYRSTSMHFDGTEPSYTTRFVGNTAYTTVQKGSPDRDVEFSCTTTFEVFDNKIIGWRYEGSDCTY